MGEAVLGLICPGMLIVAYATVFHAALTGKKTNHGWRD